MGDFKFQDVLGDKQHDKNEMEHEDESPFDPLELMAKHPRQVAAYSTLLGSGLMTPLVEAQSFNALQMRDVGKGLAIGAGALVGTCAVDALLFGDTKRTYVSHLTDIMAMPLLSYVPMNPYLKGAAYVGLHTAARAYEKWTT